MSDHQNNALIAWASMALFVLYFAWQVWRR